MRQRGPIRAGSRPAVPKWIRKLETMTKSTALSPVSSVDAAKTLLTVGGEMSSKKLQKIIYLAHENHIRETDKPLIAGDIIEAWVEGPVFRNLYQLVGNSDNGRVIPEDLPNAKVIADRETEEYFSSVYNLFKDVSGEYLSDMTHTWGSPWQMARRTIRRNGFFGWLLNPPSTEKPVISNSMIRHYFRTA